MGESNNEPSFVERMLMVLIDRDNAADALKLVGRLGPQISTNGALVVGNYLLKKGQLNDLVSFIGNLLPSPVRDCLAYQLALFCLVPDTNNLLHMDMAVKQLPIVQNEALRLFLARRCFGLLVTQTWRHGPSPTAYPERVLRDFDQLVSSVGAVFAAIDPHYERWLEQQMIEALRGGHAEKAWRINHFMTENQRHDTLPIIPL